MKPVCPLLAGLLLASTVSGATFTVTNVNDSGAGSLRQAILDANANAGADTIAFNIPGSGVHTIAPATNFDTILEAVVIDGYTQPGTSVNTDPVGTNAVLLIELDGSAMAAGGIGFNFTGVAATTVRGLVMNRWGSVAIQTAGNSVGAVITGNFVGTDPTGMTARPNAIGITPSGLGTIVGGATPADRNLISGNSHGIYVLNNGTLIQGNLIGTDAQGMLAIPNTQVAVVCASFGGAGTQIGGGAPGEGNVISGNVQGVWLSQGGVVNVVRGNRIGVNAAGTGPLPNGVGVFTSTGGFNSVIGGIGPGEGNVIAYNTGPGVSLAEGTGNVARGNSIHDNGGLGIDIGGPVGPNFNDALDVDDGPNHSQNFPIIRQVEHLGPQGAGSTRVVAKFNSTPSTTFTLDFYSNPACSDFPREFVEGEVYLGSTSAPTDPSGNFAIDVTLPVETEPGARIAITATDPNGNTSEYSQRILFSIFPASGPPTGGLPIEVHGTDFADPTTLTFGATAAAVTFVNDHQLTTSSPALAPGTVHNVVATTPDGTVGTLVNGWVSDFLDVPGAHMFYSFVTTLVSNGITVGVGGGLYGVDQPTLRQQLAVFLMKAKHGLCFAPPPCTTPVFTDVPCSLSFAPWIHELVAEGITTGCGDGTTYCPADPVKRQQMAVLLLKTREGVGHVPPACVTPTFDDVPCDSPFAPWIYELVARNITGGCGGGNYCPGEPANRGQMAVFVVKTFSLQ